MIIKDEEKKGPHSAGPRAAGNSILAGEHPACRWRVQVEAARQLHQLWSLPPGYQVKPVLGRSPLRRQLRSLTRRRGRKAYIELAHLVVGVALGEVLHVGQLQVHLRQPHQDALPRALEFFPLVGEMLQKGKTITRVLMAHENGGPQQGSS